LLSRSAKFLVGGEVGDTGIVGFNVGDVGTDEGIEVGSWVMVGITVGGVVGATVGGFVSALVVGA
jgi:hypothetical protein